MTNEITLPLNTPLLCNRCDRVSANTEPVRAIKDGHIYRVTEMTTLECGHRDAHWHLPTNKENL